RTFDPFGIYVGCCPGYGRVTSPRSEMVRGRGYGRVTPSGSNQQPKGRSPHHSQRGVSAD
ncbi:MAG: hypothetical protein ACLFMU_08790, partial [Bacteroidales bacterium]